MSGSLRKTSANTALLRAVAGFVPANVEFTIYDGLDRLPHFNPDINDEASASVRDFRARLAAAHGVLVSTPEYARGVPGVLKNALDWIVSSGELVDKPVAVISASPFPTGGDKAQESLLLTLGMLSAKIVDGGTLRIPLVTKKLNADGHLTDPIVEEELRSLLQALLGAL